MTSLWDNTYEKRKAVRLDGTQQICSRCKLPYPKISKECDHCAQLPDDELEQLRREYNQQFSSRKLQGRIAVVWGLVIAVIFVIIFLLIV